MRNKVDLYDVKFWPEEVKRAENIYLVFNNTFSDYDELTFDSIKYPDTSYRFEMKCTGIYKKLFIITKHFEKKIFININNIKDVTQSYIFDEYARDFFDLVMESGLLKNDLVK